MTRERIRIPSEKVKEGIERIISNAYRYVKDSKILLKDGSLEHAVVCAIFAAEELAKASMLSTQFEEHQEEPFIEVKGWFSHPYKMQEAKRLLGNSLIIESSRIGIMRLPFRLGVDDKEASHPVRLLCAFVDYRDEQWKFGTSYNPYMLELDLLKGIEERLNEITIKHGLEKRPQAKNM